MEKQIYEIDRISRGSSWYSEIEVLKGARVTLKRDNPSRRGPWFMASLVFQEDVPELSIEKGEHIHIHLVTLRKVDS